MTVGKSQSCNRPAIKHTCSIYLLCTSLRASQWAHSSGLVHDFLSQQNNILFLFLPELMNLFVAGRDQSAADQPNNMAEGHPPL